MAPAAGTYFYRIKSTEVDNSFSLSKIARVSIEGDLASPAINVYPNPVTGNNINLNLPYLNKDNYVLQSYDETGKLVESKTLNYDGINKQVKFTVTNLFAKGRYELVISGNGITMTSPVIRQ